MDIKALKQAYREFVAEGDLLRHFVTWRTARERMWAGLC